MIKAGLVALAVAPALLGTASVGDDSPPDKILEKTAAAYRSMQSYKAAGSVVTEIDLGVMKMSVETSFSMLLQKPNRYLISWTQKNTMTPGIVQSGAVWSDGTQPYLYMGGTPPAYAKIGSDGLALSGATGLSGGAASTIPSLFLPSYKAQRTPLSGLKNPTLERMERVGEEECYVISGSSPVSRKETLWISKTSSLIKKHSCSLEPPEGGPALPEVTDEELEESIKGMGQEVTAERKQKLREMVERSRASLGNGKVKGSSTEIHADVSSPDPAGEEFRFALPEGALLKKSLLPEAD